MDNSMIGKIEKAKRYAEERDRIQFKSFVATMRGENSTYTVTYKDGQFHSDNSFFNMYGYSAHTMAMEYILEGMIPASATLHVDEISDPSHLAKVEKAKRYAQEHDRIQFIEFEATFRGDNGTYNVGFKDGKFHSDNPFFQTHGYSAHTMAMERILEGMITLPETA